MTEMEKVIDKVQKLFALAGNNSSEEEAMAAVQKAQLLMEKYNLSHSDIGNGESKQEITAVYCKYKEKKRNSFNAPLAVLIAKNFRCRAFLAYNNSAMFFGYKQDAQAAAATFEYLYALIRKKQDSIYREYRKAGQASSGQAVVYADGFLAGLEAAFNKNEVAIMVITPQEVNDAANERTAGKSKVRGSQQTVTGENLVNYMSGYNDGKTVMDHKRIEK